MCKISAAICLTSVLWLLLLIGPIKANIRRKRLLTFPPQSPTRIQVNKNSPTERIFLAIIFLI